MTSSARIMIVDDNEHNVKVLQSMLQSQGYQVHTAHNGEQALTQIAETSPDLLILDVIMPGMDGFDVTRALRSDVKSRTIPILMVTALNELHDKIKGFEMGADDFLSRPFNSIELLARVRSLLRIKHLHDELKTKNTLLERMLTRYVSSTVIDDILEDPDQDLRLGGESCEISVLFADIRGFTRFSEQHKADQVTNVLNYIFHNLASILFEHEGTLDKYLGDALMAFFGAPIPTPDSTRHALKTAWSMQRRFAQLRRENPDLEGLGLGIGVSTGDAIVANVGSGRVMDYTVIGRPVNRANKLQEQAQSGQILVDEQTYQAAQDLAVYQSIAAPALDETPAFNIYQVTAVREPVPA